MSESKLKVLGALQLEHAGAMVEFETRKATAILVYLAMTAQNHSRDKLAALLWPEYEQSRARTYLRRALWMLKKGIGEQGFSHSHAFHLQVARQFDLSIFKLQVVNHVLTHDNRILVMK